MTTHLPHQSLLDVHQHVVPPSWRHIAEQGTNQVGWRLPEWSPDSARHFRAGRNISASVLSNNITPARESRAEQSALIRESNEYCASLVEEAPSTLGYFASVPLAHVDDSLAEIERSLETLSADGVILPSSFAGKYLFEEEFEPLWQELDRRQAVVFLHPDEPQFSAIPGIPAVLADFVLETVRCAVGLVSRGIMHRHPGARIILAHGAGGLASIAHRVAFGLPMVNPDRSAEEWLNDFRGFYVETALATTNPALASLTAFLPENRILFGTDHPYAPAPAVDAFRELFNQASLTHEQRLSIQCGAASALFPHLAPASRPTLSPSQLNQPTRRTS